MIMIMVSCYLPFGLSWILNLSASHHGYLQESSHPLHTYLPFITPTCFCLSPTLPSACSELESSNPGPSNIGLWPRWINVEQQYQKLLSRQPCRCTSCGRQVPAPRLQQVIHSHRHRSRVITCVTKRPKSVHIIWKTFTRVVG